MDQYDGLISLSGSHQNHIISFINEPDLNKDQGLLRQYFTHLTEEADFSELNLYDGGGRVLLSKLKRTNLSKLKKVNLSWNQLGYKTQSDEDYQDGCRSMTNGKVMGDILETLAGCFNLEELDLSGNNLNHYECIRQISKIMKNNQKLKKLRFIEGAMDREEWKRIIPSLAYHAFLESLAFGNQNWIGGEGAEALANILPTLPKLHRLDLSYNAICHYDARVRYDDPDEYSYDPTGYLQLASKIGQHPTLELVDIRYYESQKPKKKHLAEFIKLAGKRAIIIFK